MKFPEIKGFSVRNLKYMRKFAKEYPDFDCWFTDMLKSGVFETI